MIRRKLSSREFYFKTADETFIKDDRSSKESKVLKTYEFSKPSIFLTPKTFVKNAEPLAFRTKAEKLLELCVAIVKEWPLPSVYTWQIEEVCRWLRNYGYPQYQNTFRVNLINGRTLLLLDASALSAINIRNFDHIRHIAYGIRCLFHFELTYFARSISLPPQHYFELYKLLRVKNGTKYELSQPIDLWRRMKLIRPCEETREHWDILDRWLKFETELQEKELLGNVKRYNLYECKKKTEHSLPVIKGYKTCSCMPPCECFWT